VEYNLYLLMPFMPTPKISLFRDSIRSNTNCTCTCTFILGVGSKVKTLQGEIPTFLLTLRKEGCWNVFVCKGRITVALLLSEMNS
jgi:hypothetical protein